MTTGQALNEYLVSLGVKVDENGVRKLMNTLRSTKFAVAGLTTALAGVAVGIAKASQSLSDARMRFEDMARTTGKSTEAIEKQEIALRAMGKTLQEVNRNERLRKTHEELKRIAGQLSMPQAGEGRAQLEGMMLEFQRLKVTSTYLMHHINEVFLEKLAGPLSNLRKALEDIRSKLVLNMPKISQVVGTALANFMQLIGAGVKGISDLGKLIVNLPTHIHQMLGAFVGFWAVLKASPVFWILAGLTSLLLLLDDFQAYKRGDKNVLGDIWGAMEEGTLGEKLSEKIFAGLEGFDQKIKEFFNVGDKIASQILDGIIEYDFKKAGEKTGSFVQKLFDTIFGITQNSDGSGIIFGNKIISIIKGIVKGIGSYLIGVFNTIEWDKLGINLAGFANSLFTWIANQFDNVGKEGGLIQTAGELLESIITGIGKFVINLFNTIKWEELGVNLFGFVNSLLTWISSSFKKVGPDGGVIQVSGEVLESVITSIGRFLIHTFNGIKWGELGVSLTGFVTKLYTWISTQFGQVGKKGGIIQVSADVINSIAQSVGRFVVGALQGIGWNEIITSNIGAGESIFGGLWDALFGTKMVTDLSTGEMTKVGTGLFYSFMDIGKSIVDALVEAVGSIKWAEHGSRIGQFVKKIFIGIGDLLSVESNKEGGGMLGSILDAGIAIANGLLDAIGSFFKNVSAKDLASSVSSFINNLFGMITRAFDGKEVDAEELGKKIGQAIMDAISFTAEFLVKLAEDMLTSLDGEALLKFVEVGFKIGKGLLSGFLKSFGIGIIGLFEGEKAAEEARANLELSERIEEKKVVAVDPNTGELFTVDEHKRMYSGPLLTVGTDQEKARGLKSSDDDSHLAALSQVWYDMGINWSDAKDDGSFYAMHSPDMYETTETMKRLMPFNRTKASWGAADIPEQYQKMIDKIFGSLMLTYRSGDTAALLTHGGLIYELQEALKSMEGPNLYEIENIYQRFQDMEGAINFKVDRTQIQNEIDKGTYTIDATVVLNSGDTPQATGGRFTSPTRVLVSETGQSEYIIPMNRPERAKGLILQMLSEMGSGANDILRALGVGSGGGSLGGIDSRLAMAGAYPAGGGSGNYMSNSGNSVNSYPVINVYGSSDPVLTGRVAFEASEQTLIKHVRGVLGQ